MQGEGRGEKFLNGGLRWFNKATLLKQASKDRSFAHAAGKLLKHAGKRIWISDYQVKAHQLIAKISSSAFSCFKTSVCIIFSVPAVWIQGLPLGACFKSLVSCCHPHSLSRTSPLCIWIAQNSRIWKIYCEKHTFALDKYLKSRFCDFEAWIEEIEATDCVDF